MSDSQLTLTPNEPLLIDVSREFDGYTFQLDPLSLSRVRQHLPNAPQKMPRIFISFDLKEEFSKLVGPTVSELVKMLTGLDAESAAQLGGVEFRDPLTEQSLFTWHPAHS